MRRDKIQEEVRRFAEENQYIAGICKAGEPPGWVSGGRLFPSRSNGEADPGLFLPGADRIIVLGRSYYKTIEVSPDDGVPRGRLSFLAVGPDYHRTMAEKLQELAEILLKQEVFPYRLHVDSGPLPEKELAVRAGLGFRGKNGLIISPRLGSFFTIGLLVTALPSPLSAEANETTHSCGGCTRCIDACPTGALSGGQGPDRGRCLAYLTQCKEPDAEQEAILRNNPGNHLYGCDICQAACPYNQGLTGEAIRDREEIFPALKPLAELSRAELKKRFGPTAAGWRADCVQRNARWILGR